MTAQKDSISAHHSAGGLSPLTPATGEKVLGGPLYLFPLCGLCLVMLSLSDLPLKDDVDGRQCACGGRPQ